MGQVSDRRCPASGDEHRVGTWMEETKDVCRGASVRPSFSRDKSKVLKKALQILTGSTGSMATGSTQLPHTCCAPRPRSRHSTCLPQCVMGFAKAIWTPSCSFLKKPPSTLFSIKERKMTKMRTQVTDSQFGRKLTPCKPFRLTNLKAKI